MKLIRPRILVVLLLPIVAAAIMIEASAPSARIIHSPEPVGEAVSRESAFYERWNAYVAWEEELAFQDSCKPFIREPAEGIAYRGTVVFLHGFSACTQQYYDLSALLAKQGYRTIVPVLPGHGRPYPQFDKDDSAALPTPGSFRDAYDAFSDQINGIMEYADGERVIGGLSGGGAAALYVNDRGRDVYDRNLVIAPFIDIAGGDFVNGAMAFIGAIPVINLVSATPFNTADFCLEKRQQGKASYCKWQLRGAAGMRSLGQAAAKSVRIEPLTNRVQVIGVNGDNSVSLDRVRELIATQMATDGTTACFYPEGVPHSMFSRYDHPGVDMYWLDDFNRAAVAFITTGAAFPSEPRDGDAVALCTLMNAP